MSRLQLTETINRMMNKELPPIVGNSLSRWFYENKKIYIYYINSHIIEPAM